MLKNWRELKVGDTVNYYVDDFDGSSILRCTIVNVTRDFAVAFNDDLEIELYIDDYNSDLFKLVRRYDYSTK